MSLRSWLRGARPSSPNRPRSARPQLQPLEERAVPAGPTFFDFNHSPPVTGIGTRDIRALRGGSTSTSSPTAAGYTSVLPTDTYNATRGYGWQTATTGFDRGAFTTDSRANLLRDGHLATDNTFLVSVPNGRYTVTFYAGDASTARDAIQVSSNDGVELGRVQTFSPAGQFAKRSFNVTVNNGQLRTRFQDLGGANGQFALNGLEVRPANPLENPDQRNDHLGPQVADGMSATGLFTGNPTGGVRTILVTRGTILTVARLPDPFNSGGTVSDADPLLAGFQVVGTGNFSITIRSPSTPGNGFFLSELTDADDRESTLIPYV